MNSEEDDRYNEDDNNDDDDDMSSIYDHSRLGRSQTRQVKSQGVRHGSGSGSNNVSLRKASAAAKYATAPNQSIIKSQKNQMKKKKTAVNQVTQCGGCMYLCMYVRMYFNMVMKFMYVCMYIFLYNIRICIYIS